MSRDQLIDTIKREFGENTEIVLLAELTSKIAIVSKVRIGKKRDVKEYYEVSLNNIDEFGNIYIPEETVMPEAANSSAIRSQSLNHTDLLLNQRTQKLKVGFINSDTLYPSKEQLPVVGNNSMIRMQFKEANEELSRFVQTYLQLPYVLDYLNSLPSSSTTDRKILSSAQLQELPIPKYFSEIETIDHTSIPLSEILHSKSELLLQAKKMKEAAQRLIESYQTQKMESIKVNFTKSYSSSDKERDEKELKILQQISKEYNKLLDK